MGSGRCPALDAHSHECPLRSSSRPFSENFLPAVPQIVRRRRMPFIDDDERKVVRGPCQAERMRKEGRMIKGVLAGAVLLLVAVVILQSLPDFQRYVQLRDM